MPFTRGPLRFLTDGSPKSLAALAQVHAYAGALGRGTTLILRVPRTDQPTMIEKRVAMVRKYLAPEFADLPIIGVRPAEFRPALRQAAADEGGIVALVRRSSGFGLAGSSEYERLLFDEPLPLLLIPPGSSVAPIRRVLFPADLATRSEILLDQTAALCAQLGAELHLLHVYGSEPVVRSAAEQAERSALKSPYELLARDQAAFRALHERATAAGVTVVAGTAEGIAHTQILAYAEKLSIDLIVMASHGPRSTGDIIGGTTTARVIRASRVLVLAAFV